MNDSDDGLSKEIASYFDEEPSAESLELLQKWLDQDGDNRRAFAQFCTLHCQTHELLREEDVRRFYLPASALAGTPDAAGGAARRVDATYLARQTGGESEPKEEQRRRFASRKWAWAAIAAGLLLATGVAMLNRPPANNATNKSAAAASEKSGVSAATVNSVATVTGAVDCRWAAKAGQAKYGEAVLAGTQIALESGLMQLTFDSGAKIILQGPCEFLVQEEMVGYLLFGKLTASVPRRAAGFTVRTPTAEIVDLGTEFGVDAEQGGASEAHVFKGEIVACALDSNGAHRGSAVRLLENNAVRYDDAAGIPSTFAANSEKFVRRITPRTMASPAHRLPFVKGLALWLSADGNVKQDESGGVISWGDQLDGDNQSAEDAIQGDERARPLWIPEAYGEQPTLRFDGRTSFLTTTPLVTTDNQTVICIGAFGKDDVDHVGQIINYNGPPQRDLRRSSGGEPGVLQITARYAAERDEFRLDTLVFAGFKAGDLINVGFTRARLPELRPRQLFLLAYVYDMKNNLASMYLNGRLLNAATAPYPSGIISRKVIGRHGNQPLFFNGDLSELLIYNRALTEQQLGRVTNDLAKKYGVALDADANVER